MKTHKLILGAVRRLAPVLSTHFFVLAALAQSPLPDSFNPSPDNSVYSLAVQADGKILMGGRFTSSISRLYADGTLDGSFSPGANGEVDSIVVQPDGKIIVGGWFNKLGGQSRIGIGRLNADGTLDTGFNTGVSGTTSGGYPLSVSCLALQSDGKVLVGGPFTMLGGQSHSSLAAR